jgi:hypothetical protein
LHDTVEIESAGELKWISYLIGINENVLSQKLMFKTTEVCNEKVSTPLHMEQALDTR